VGWNDPLYGAERPVLFGGGTTHYVGRNDPLHGVERPVILGSAVTVTKPKPKTAVFVKTAEN